MNAPHIPRPNPKQVRIGLWGPPGSGKTTFLAALELAVTRYPGARWIMSGSDPESEKFLRETIHHLTYSKTFPQFTDQATGLVFRFNGTRDVERKNFLGKRIRTTEVVEFELAVLDVPGGMYRHVPGAPGPGTDDGFEVGDAGDTDPAKEERLLAHLMECNGILYLFDPERDRNSGDAFSYFHPVLQKLTSRIMAQRTHSEPKLRHHVAVCVTKFDQPEIFQLARNGGYTVQAGEPPYMPFVPNHLADGFFRSLCEDPTTNTDLVELMLRTHFNKIEYFVTSSVGFYTNGRRFELYDSHNVERVGPGPEGLRIRGKVQPINVFEPLLWLFDSLHLGGTR